MNIKKNSNLNSIMTDLDKICNSTKILNRFSKEYWQNYLRASNAGSRQQHWLFQVHVHYRHCGGMISDKLDICTFSIETLWGFISRHRLKQAHLRNSIFNSLKWTSLQTPSSSVHASGGISYAKFELSSVWSLSPQANSVPKLFTICVEHVDIKLKFQFDMQTMIIPLILAILSQFQLHTIRKIHIFYSANLKCVEEEFKVRTIWKLNMISATSSVGGGVKWKYFPNLRLLVVDTHISSPNSLSPRDRKFMLFNIKSIWYRHQQCLAAEHTFHLPLPAKTDVEHDSQQHWRMSSGIVVDERYPAVVQVIEF